MHFGQRLHVERQDIGEYGLWHGDPIKGYEHASVTDPVGSELVKVMDRSLPGSHGELPREREERA